MSGSAVWTGLTRRERALLRAVVGDRPARPRRAVLARMVDLGLVNVDLSATAAGRKAVNGR